MAVTGAGIVLMLVGCGGSTRSTASFCSTLKQGTAQLKAAAQQSESLSQKDALLALISAFGNLGDFSQFLDRLDRTAPSEIADDMNVVDNDFHNVLNTSGQAAGEALTGNFGGMAQLALNAMLHANSYRRIDQFAQANCGMTLFGPATSS
jgi:hypothetical protein